MNYPMLLSRAYILLRLTRQVHHMTAGQIEYLDHEIKGLLREMDPEAVFDDVAALEQFKREAT